MHDEQEALAYSRGDIKLGFCPTCGFVTNTRYNDRLKNYTPDYEETQHFSPRFGRFAHWLAQHWVDQFDLRERHIVEIGCGKGEFLALICQLGNSCGTGIDPTCVPERLPASVRDRIHLVRDYYGWQHAAADADVILCRHTLEHVHQVQDFLLLVRQTLGQRPDTRVLFELPDTRRILQQGAFWDVYYEHCAYFTAGSLARLFRRCRFEVTHLERVFDDQYLILAAQPVDQVTPPSLAIENDLDEITREAVVFSQRCDEAIHAWRGRLRQLCGQGKRAVVWGAGSKAVSFLTAVDSERQVAYAVDINPHKQDKFLPGTGHRVVSPEFLSEFRPHAVIVMNPIYAEEVGGMLDEMGVQPELLLVP